MSEEIKKIEGENNIPTIEEMKKEALKLANNIPNLKEKHQFMIETRGNIIELSIIIETCFNQLITETGKEMVFDHGKKELHLMKGIRTKNEISGFLAPVSPSLSSSKRYTSPRLSPILSSPSPSQSPTITWSVTLP